MMVIVCLIKRDSRIYVTIQKNSRVTSTHPLYASLFVCDYPSAIKSNILSSKLLEIILCSVVNTDEYLLDKEQGSASVGIVTFTIQ